MLERCDPARFALAGEAEPGAGERQAQVLR